MTFISVTPLPYLFFLTWLFFFALHVKPKEVVRSTYIVHMNKFFMPKVFTSHHNWHLALIDTIQFSKIFSYDDHQSTPSIIYSYDNALHGFSASLSLMELEILKKSKGYVFAHREKVYKLHTTRTPEFLSLNHFSGLWPTSKYGKDIIIGIIDTGIWPEHPSFKDNDLSNKTLEKWKGSCEEGQFFTSSMCNSKILGARYFKEGALSENKGLKILIDSPRDNSGHGTLMSSIAAGNYVNGASYFGYANGIAKGVAPKARLAIYRVTTNLLSAYPADVLAGMNQAITDGVDVISISLGNKGLPMYVDSIAKASFSTMEKGIVVSSAAGNSGPSLGTITNGFPWVITVSAGSIDRWFAGTLTLKDGVTITGWSTFPGLYALPILPLVYQNTVSACDDPKLLSQFSYGIILCNSGDITHQIFALSYSNISGAILINDDFVAHKLYCPCVVLTSKQASLVFQHLQSNKPPLVSIKFKQTIKSQIRAPYALDSSSRGPSQSYSYILKPDIMAPGQLVLGGSIPLKPIAKINLFEEQPISLYNNYTLVSGTSVACPHVSGVVALLKSAHPDWSPAAIRSAIMTTANPLDNTINPILSGGNDFRFASPLDMGAGHINPNQALDPGLIYDVTRQDYVNLLCSLNFSSKKLFAITRSHNLDCSNPSNDLNYPSFIVLYKINDYALWRIHRFKRIVTNVGKSTTTYKATVDSPKGTEVIVSPNILEFGKDNKYQHYKITIKYKGHKERNVSFGELVWIEQNGTHHVRSPIIISPVMNTTMAERWNW